MKIDIKRKSPDRQWEVENKANMLEVFLFFYINRLDSVMVENEDKCFSAVNIRKKVNNLVK